MSSTLTTLRSSLAAEGCTASSPDDLDPEAGQMARIERQE